MAVTIRMRTDVEVLRVVAGRMHSADFIHLADRMGNAFTIEVAADRIEKRIEEKNTLLLELAAELERRADGIEKHGGSYPHMRGMVRRARKEAGWKNLESGPFDLVARPPSHPPADVDKSPTCSAPFVPPPGFNARDFRDVEREVREREEADMPTTMAPASDRRSLRGDRRR